MAEKRVDGVELAESFGEGCCGEVFAVLGDPTLVVKSYRSMAIDRAFLARNFARMDAMPAHEGIVTVHHHRFERAPYEVLMDRVRGKPLSAIPERKESATWGLIQSLADALGHAHKFGVFHGHLHPANLHLISEEGDARIIVTDFGTGLVGDVHHIDLAESTFFAAPDQLLCDGADWDNGRLQKWDVYSFGLVAFWLIHGHLPRGLGFIEQRERDLACSGGRPVPIEIHAFVADVLETGTVSWRMGRGIGKEIKLYRGIVDDCLELDPAKRPVDMREVRNRFRAIEQKIALEDAEARVLKEKRKQKAKLFGARAIAACLGLSFLGATYFLVEYLRKTYFYRNQVSELDQVVHSQKAHISHLDERWSETRTDLKKSREAADDFFQRMAQGGDAGGSGVAMLKREDLEKSREYYRKTLADIGEYDTTILERARALHSLAHIERKMGINELAFQHFRDTIDTFGKALLTVDRDEGALFDVHRRLADCYENVSVLLENPIGAEALASLERAVGHFDAVLDMKPGDFEYATRQAGTTFKLGLAYEAHQKFDEAIAAYSRSAEMASRLREKHPDAPALTELIGKLQFRAASALRAAGRIDESIDAHVAALETLEGLRDINGFSPLQSLQMASSFVELGDLFAIQEAPGEDLDQLYNESLRLLTPLNTSDPGDVEVAILLCRSMTRLGEIERAAGQWSSGYRLSVRGIETLKSALDRQPDNVEGMLVLAESRIELLRFLANERTAALNLAARGLETVEQAKTMLGEGSAVREPTLSHLQGRLGTIFQAYGDVCKELGETANARKCYEQASRLVSSLQSDPEMIER